MPSKKPISEMEKDVNALVLRVKNNTNNIKRMRAFLIDRGLVYGTPVDTGRARASWNVSINHSDRSVRAPAAVKMKDALQLMYASVVTGTNIEFESTGTLLDAARETIKTAKLGDVIYLTNALPYIKRLNEGWSPQANPGWIEAVVLKAKYAKINIDSNTFGGVS